MTPERRKRLEEERAWATKHLASCERDLKRVPWLGLFGLSIFPAGWFLGFLGVMLAILGTIVLVAFSVYLVNGHRAEYETQLEELDRKLSR